jgi:hypothetical protein
MKGKKMYLLLCLVILCIPFMIGDLCDGGGGDDPGPSTGAGSFNLRVKFHSAYGSNIEVNLTVVWSGTYVSGSSDSTVGVDTPFTIEDRFEGITDANGDCYFTRYISNLRPGRWEITARDRGTWSTTCTVDLSPGTNMNVRFTHGCAGCSTGLTYPCS